MAIMISVDDGDNIIYQYTSYHRQLWFNMHYFSIVNTAIVLHILLPSFGSTNTEFEYINDVECGLQQSLLTDNVYSNLTGLEVMPSTISMAGMGLFAAKDYHFGEIICEYTGKRLSFRQRWGVSDSTYVMGGFAKFSAIDAKECLSVFGRYINDHSDMDRINSYFLKIKDQFKALVVANRNILKGEEIFASYGNIYWENRIRNRN
eukprot:749369_1